MATTGRTPTLPTPAPQLSPDSVPYFAAAAEGRLALTRCTSCRRIIWYPKPLCAACLGAPTEWIDASGRGVIHSFSVIRKGQGAYAEAGPYVVAIVELEEGPRMMTNIVDSDIDALAVGQPVEVVFDSVNDTVALPRFKTA